jgi:hypothetical protein
MASGAGAKDYAYRAAESALRSFLDTNRLAGEVMQGRGYGAYRVRYSIQGEPSITIAIPVTACTSGAEPVHAVQATVDAIFDKTAHGRFQVVVIDGGELNRETVQALERRPRVVVHRSAQSQVVPALNGTAIDPETEYVVILQPGVEPLSRDWLEGLVEHCQLRGVGAVGPKLLSPNGRIQSAGVLFVGGRLCHAYSGQVADHPGYFLSAQVTRNYLAVSGACLMTKASVFRDIGGFDPRFSTALGAIDYCLRLRDRKLRTVFTPYAELMTGGPASDYGSEREWPAFRARWPQYQRLDPYYNPNLPKDFVYYPASG